MVPGLRKPRASLGIIFSSGTIRGLGIAETGLRVHADFVPAGRI
jgi:hypothetical protein